LRIADCRLQGKSLQSQPIEQASTGDKEGRSVSD
jgi:hypothetical protein